MLKVKGITFQDNKNRTYYIPKKYIQDFPIIGGERAINTSSRAWNQHGNTFLNSFMEPFDSSITFILYSRYFTSDNDYAKARKQVIDILNPLNGIVKMIVELSNNVKYTRDITFINNPLFPIGFENRNRDWQKVQVQFTCHDPFWYSYDSIIESFSGYHGEFKLPYLEMSVPKPIHFGNILTHNDAINTGQAEAPVEITITGSCENPKILNETTGEYLWFKNLTMGANDTLYINTGFGKRKITLNGVNAFNKLDYSSVFFNLRIGKNQINFYDDSFSVKPNIIFKWKNLFLTI